MPAISRGNVIVWGMVLSSLMDFYRWWHPNSGLQQ
jgi:hypothetical protein